VVRAKSGENKGLWQVSQPVQAVQGAEGSAPAIISIPLQLAAEIATEIPGENVQKAH